MRNVAYFLFLLFVSFILFNSCGIDMLNEYLEYPPRLLTSTITAANFNPPEQYEDSFLGIEFYYRIYNNQAKAIADNSSFNTKQDAETLPGTTVLSYLLSQSGMKYRKLNSEFLPFSVLKNEIPSTSLELSIELKSDNLYFKNGTSETKLYRNLTPIKSFSEVEPVNGDYDLEFDVSSGSPFYIQIYAVSFGIDLVSFNSLFSKATFLGLLML